MTFSKFMLSNKRYLHQSRVDQEQDMSVGSANGKEMKDETSAKLADTCSCKDTFFLFKNDRRLHRLELVTDYICGCSK